MSPTFWLRAASAVTLLYAIGHALGGLESWSPAGPTATMAAMRSFEFDVMGRTRTYLDFYLGFGHYISTLLLLQAALLWQLGAAAARGAPVRPLVLSMFAATVAGTAIVARFMFIVPIVMSAAIAGCLLMAFFTLTGAAPIGDRTVRG